ncbi:hypothetical protein CANARDRAFT_24880 [[Candida] arabinofermentans NRRL YB-2248]|uniref:Uncharacterized protein n=1 Tax=[Candida] arabinofermentans NRRL YB-2248 TaxID=983967 RepID=A0A1E4SVY2_9ASCO|nr:hypothetical protein CANARDRAFT_24880 [[Candida] arabinofermentans NRRL YB-2248]
MNNNNNLLNSTSTDKSSPKSILLSTNYQIEDNLNEILLKLNELKTRSKGNFNKLNLLNDNIIKFNDILNEKDFNNNELNKLIELLIENFQNNNNNDNNDNNDLIKQINLNCNDILKELKLQSNNNNNNDELILVKSSLIKEIEQLQNDKLKLKLINNQYSNKLNDMKLEFNKLNEMKLELLKELNIIKNKYIESELILSNDNDNNNNCIIKDNQKRNITTKI